VLASYTGNGEKQKSVATHMSALPEIQSEAFKQAVLRSERIRILGMLGTLALLLTIGTVRALLIGTSVEIGLLPRLFWLVGCFAVYESLMLVRVNRRINSRQDFPAWVWSVNLFVETMFPTVGLILLTKTPVLGPYRALVAPAVLAYFFFIILSTLRLSPLLSRLTGLFSSAGYMAVTAYTFWHYPFTEGAFSLPVYVTYAIMILLGGFIAGAVATEIRKHVIASLQEAETRRQIERIEQDLSTARSIQQGLLPSRPPAAAQFDIAGWNLPADATGGDYFDWQELPDSKIAVSLADVSGHGIGPALVMAVCRAYARSSFSTAKDLQGIMGHINELLVNDLPSERFVTYVVALLDPIKSQVQLISAGHGPLLLYNAARDEFQNLEPQGIPFGLFPGFPYGSPHHFEMTPGDMLVLTTDGLFEWANAEDEQFGLARLKAAIQASRDRPAAEVIAHLYTSVKEFAGGTQQQDDLTAVVLKRKSSL
jgi:serine phosphatase RsbU (regulator of sigma subunit)